VPAGAPLSPALHCAAAMPEPDSLSVWTIEPRSGGAVARLREVWTYRRLLRFFATRAVTKLYRNTILGKSWLLLRPLVPLFVRAIVFGGLLNVGSNNIPYFLFLVIGTTCWDLFAGSLTWATRSLEQNRGLIGKVYVPRVILPVAMTAPAFINLFIHLGVAACTAGYFYVTHGTPYVVLSPQLLWALGGLLLAVTLALGIGFFTSVLATIGRDVRFTLAFVLDFWYFLTPVLYPVSAVPAEYRWALYLNPMAAAVEMFKFGLLGVGHVEPALVGSATAVTLAVLGAGLWYFTRAESDAVDRV
jgi:lipopolysaccharide transport system permease protein